MSGPSKKAARPPAEEGSRTPTTASAHPETPTPCIASSAPPDSLSVERSESQSATTAMAARVQGLAGVLRPTGSTEEHSSPSHSYVVRPMEIVESIKGLHELRQQGGLTEAEFTQAKQQILDSSSSSSASAPPSRRGGLPREGASHTPPKAGSSRTHSRSTRRRTGRSSSSSSSSSDRFITVPRSEVWRTLHSETPSGLLLPKSARDRLSVPVYFGSLSLVRSPLLTSGGTVVGFHTDASESPDVCCDTHRRDGYQEILSEGAGGSRGAAAVPGFPLTAVPSLKTSGGGGGEAVSMPLESDVTGRHPGSAHGSEGREKTLYGAFALRDDGARQDGAATLPTMNLNNEEVVQIRYFNSRGGSGTHFAEVELHPSQLRDPVFVHKGQPQVVPAKTQPVTPSPPCGSEAVPALPAEELTEEEQRAWEAMSKMDVSSTSSRYTKSSYFEQSYNWYWIDVTGRDAKHQRYDATLRFLTNRFKLCESFLVDREHTLVMPQVCESPVYPGQFLLNLRVASDKLSISDDSVMELTNRWIIVVDLKQHLVITLHRVDTPGMASLRTQWRGVMEKSDVSFQEFLLKIIDDAIYTYQLSLDVHTALLDKCEVKIFVEKSPLPPTPELSGQFIDIQILNHFARSSRSPFLRRLLDEHDRRPLNKSEMNGFLHHLHRRTSVQHRMLNVTQVVLAKAFTKLRLCSREMAEQMCTSCVEIGDRAMEVRDDAKTLLDLHISLQSFRTNELMAVLTRVTMLFTPLTFLAGVYGMNFQRNFPELTWDYGYPFFWMMCVILVVLMHTFFVREG